MCSDQSSGEAPVRSTVNPSRVLDLFTESIERLLFHHQGLPSGQFRGEMEVFSATGNLQDFRSACRVRFRSRGVDLVPGAFVAVFTSDSRISSSPSVNCSSLLIVLGEWRFSGRRLRQVKGFPGSGVSTVVIGEPKSCLKYPKFPIWFTLN